MSERLPVVYECYVLRNLQQAHSATSNEFQTWNRNSIDLLPPLLVSGSREITDAPEEAEMRSESWHQVDPVLHITKIDGADLNPRNWTM